MSSAHVINCCEAFSALADQLRRDDLLDLCVLRGLVDGTGPTNDGYVDIRCPWMDEHTGQKNTGTAIHVTDGQVDGFQCHHAHCVDRTIGDVRKWFGLKVQAKSKADPLDKERLKAAERIKREIRRELDAEERGEDPPLVFQSEAELLTEMPAPELIRGLLIQGSLFMLFGPKNLGKTFLTIALAYAIASDQHAFLEVPVDQHGDVVLILAEGGSRLGLRLRAWRQAYAVNGTTHRLHVLKRAINLTDTDAIDRLIERIRGWRPVLVIFDTLSRCMPGAVENAAEDMSAAVANLDRIRVAVPGVTVGVIHHPTKANEDIERGAGTFANAVDTVMNVRDENGVLTLSCKYTRDLEPFAPIQYSLEPLVLEDMADAEGHPYASAVVRRLSEEGAARARQTAEGIEQRILTTLYAHGPTSASDLTAVLRVRKDSILAACHRLQADKRVKHIGKGKNARWEIVSAKVLKLVDRGTSEPNRPASPGDKEAVEPDQPIEADEPTGEHRIIHGAPSVETEF